MASDEAWQGGDWMARLPSHLAALPLTRLALPGSHDSGADESLSTAYPVANDETAGLRRLGRWKIVRRLIRRWAITQKRNIAEQLELGVRYLDLRLSFPDKGGPRDLRLVHALYGTPLLECLEQVRVFLDEHPKEVVILDFNHMFDVDEEVYCRVRHLILETLGAARVCEDRSPAETSLEWMWSRRVQAVILSCAEDPAGFWPQSRICSPYADTNDISRLLDFLGRHIVYRRFDRFYVLQGVTTATHGDILLHLWATLDTYLSERTTEAIKHFIDAFPWPWLFNIVMCDQVDADFCRRVVQLNYRVLEREISSKSL